MIKFKEQVKLQKISEDAWIVNDDEKRVGILHKSVQDKYTYLDKTETILFENKVEVQEAFDNKFIKLASSYNSLGSLSDPSHKEV